MTETQKRIKAYQDALPGLRERVAAVALLLVMSMAMMTSASFAWLTISRSPEVAGANTTIAANGSLEIALATGDVKDPVKEPGASQVGDSSAAENQSVIGSNVTWGNLINLADPAYGLESLSLRPAQLNTVSLLESPLFGAMYGQDGRITQLTSNFAYTSWIPETDEKPGYFGIAEQYGVRAISSTKIEAVGAEGIYLRKLEEANGLNLAAGSLYTSMASDKTNMQSLATMMGKYMQDRMNSGNKYDNPECDVKDIQNLADMYEQFLAAFDKEAEAMAALVNLQLFLKHGEGNYNPYTYDMIYTATDASLAAIGVKLSNLAQFKADHTIIVEDVVKLRALGSSGGTLKWEDSGLNNIVNRLVNVGECTMGDGTKISSIGASNATNYMSGTQEAIITNGILKNFEARTGAYINVKEMQITCSVYRTVAGFPVDLADQKVKANVHTNAADLGYTLFNNDMNYTKQQNTGNYQGGILTAMDTYGLAVDFWVRTNSESSYLTLEGNVLTKTERKRATGTDINGNVVELFVVELSGMDANGTPTSYKVDLYQGKRTIYHEIQNEDGSVSVEEEIVDAWYKAANHALMTEEELGGKTPIGKYDEIVTVIGYEGENRVWDSADKDYLTTDATTQGSGSCYVFYADTPEDQASSLELLESFNVAFVSADGTLMAKAVMDTEHYYAENGRVTVPLVLSSNDSTHVGEDAEGNPIYGITLLEKNVPTFITAIVYLDGTLLNNDKVLAASNIQGRLNIQFGSNQSLKSIENEELMNKEIHISASVEGTEFDFDTHQGDMVSTVKVNVSGSEPSTVKAFFIRTINAAQGSREKEMTFVKNTDGEWEASYTFTGPGIYVLRSVELDGISYDLDEEQKVTIKGFAISSIAVREANANNHIFVMSAQSTAPVTVELRFATSDVDKMPKSVQARFLRKDGTAVNIDLKYDATTQLWSGAANFVSSGEYTMQYVVLDGKHVELNGPTYDDDTGDIVSYGQWYTADITLGMRVAVYTTSPHEFLYEGESMDSNKKLLKMQVEIMDNTGKPMEELANVELNYTVSNSSVKKMHAVLKWTGKYYEGELQTMSQTAGAGIWRFYNVIAQGNTLTVATTAPVFTISSPNPPVYMTHDTVSYQYAPNNDAVMRASISNTETATVKAYIEKVTSARDGQDNGVWVEGVRGTQYDLPNNETYNEWSFPVPQLDNNGDFVDKNGNQDGNWHLTKLHISGVFDKAGNYYGEENPMEVVLYDAENPSNSVDPDNITKVVVRTFAVFTQNKSAAFGREGNVETGAVNGAFMAGYDISGLEVRIQDFESKKIEGISDVSLYYTYGNDSQAKGGYVGTNGTTLNNTLCDFSLTFTNPSGDGVTYVQSGTYTLRYAGSYTPTFKFKISGKEQTRSGTELPTNTSRFSVWSVVPTVSITDISLDGAGAYSVDLNTTGSLTDSSSYRTESSGCITDYIYTCTTHKDHIVTSKNTQYLSRIENGGKTAWIYFKCSHTDDATYSGGKKNGNSGADFKGHKYVYNNGDGVPKATLMLDKKGNATKAVLTFAKSGGGDVVMITQYTKDSSGNTYWGDFNNYGTSSFEWTTDAACTRFIGVMDNDTDAKKSDTKTAAGTLTASTLILTYDGKEFSFTIPTITIHNPC